MGDSGGWAYRGREEGSEMKGGGCELKAVLGVCEFEYSPRGVVIALGAALSGGERHEARRERDESGVKEGCGSG